MALVEVPGLPFPIRPVAAVPGRLAPVAGEVGRGRERCTGAAAWLADTRGQRLEHRHCPSVDVDVVDVDLVVEVKLGALEEEGVTNAGNGLVVVEGGGGEDRLHLDVDKHDVSVGSEGHLAVGGEVLERTFMKVSSHLESEGSTRRMFGVGHHRDVAPLDSEPVGQGEQGDGGGVGPAGVQLDPQGRDVLRLVDVVVEPR